MLDPTTKHHVTFDTQLPYWLYGPQATELLPHRFTQRLQLLEHNAWTQPRTSSCDQLFLSWNQFRRCTYSVTAIPYHHGEKVI